MYILFVLSLAIWKRYDMQMEHSNFKAQRLTMLAKKQCSYVKGKFRAISRKTTYPWRSLGFKKSVNCGKLWLTWRRSCVENFQVQALRMVWIWRTLLTCLLAQTWIKIKRKSQISFRQSQRNKAEIPSQTGLREKRLKNWKGDWRKLKASTEDDGRGQAASFRKDEECKLWQEGECYKNNWELSNFERKGITQKRSTIEGSCQRPEWITYSGTASKLI